MLHLSKQSLIMLIPALAMFFVGWLSHAFPVPHHYVNDGDKIRGDDEGLGQDPLDPVQNSAVEVVPMLLGGSGENTLGRIHCGSGGK